MPSETWNELEKFLERNKMKSIVLGEPKEVISDVNQASDVNLRTKSFRGSEFGEKLKPGCYFCKLFNEVSQSVPDPLFARGCRAQRGQFPHETYCQQYYNCWDGRATIDECPGKLLFNPVISACDYPEAVNCLARLRNPEPAITTDGRCLKQFGIFPDPTDCTAFYECSHGRSFRQVCPYYTAFDERYLVCVHAHAVECGGRGGVYGTLAPPRFMLPDGGVAPAQQIGLPPPPPPSAVGSRADASGQERQYETPISPEASFRCPQPRGLYSNALDCSKFWLCREYKPSLLNCPTGQLFDLPSLSCTNPEKAQCSSISPRT